MHRARGGEYKRATGIAAIPITYRTDTRGAYLHEASGRKIAVSVYFKVRTIARSPSSGLLARRVRSEIDSLLHDHLRSRV